MVGKYLNPWQKIARRVGKVQLQPLESVTEKTNNNITSTDMSNHSNMQYNFLQVHVSDKIDSTYVVDSAYNAESPGKIYVPDNDDRKDYWYGSPI